MQISELQPRLGKVELEAEVIEKGELREFEKFGKSGKVCNAKVKDATGEIVLTLWNDEIDQVDVGDMIKVSNGWVSEWQGEMQLSAGKFGTLEVVKKGEGKTEAKEEKKEVKAAKPENFEETDIDSDFEEEFVDD